LPTSRSQRSHASRQDSSRGSGSLKRCGGSPPAGVHRYRWRRCPGGPLCPSKRTRDPACTGRGHVTAALLQPLPCVDIGADHRPQAGRPTHTQEHSGRRTHLNMRLGGCGDRPRAALTPERSTSRWRETSSFGRSMSSSGHHQGECRSTPTLAVLRKLAIALSVSADTFVFDTDERGPDEDLRLQFEATTRLSAEEKLLVRRVIEGILLSHEAKRWAA
jgi:hypothetical protein